jgi:penicillin-insensitive murein endopeptidase
LKKSAIWQAEQQQAKPEPEPEPKPAKPTKPASGKPPLHLADLPKDCRDVLAAGGDVPVITADTGLPPIALRALASKDAGPPLPRLTQEQLQILLAGGDLTASMSLPDRNPRRGAAIAGN